MDGQRKMKNKGNLPCCCVDATMSSSLTLPSTLPRPLPRLRLRSLLCVSPIGAHPYPSSHSSRYYTPTTPRRLRPRSTARHLTSTVITVRTQSMDLGTVSHTVFVCCASHNGMAEFLSKPPAFREYALPTVGE